MNEGYEEIIYVQNILTCIHIYLLLVFTGSCLIHSFSWFFHLNGLLIILTVSLLIFSCFIIRFKHYYHQLDHDAQLTVFVFVNVLLTELQGVTYRHLSSRSSSTLMQAQQQSIDFHRQLTGDTEERLGAICMTQINKHGF